MRRVSAIILLIPVMALFVGAVTAVSYCAKVVGSDCGGMGKMQGECMMAARHQACDGRIDRCGQKCNKGHTSKDEQKGKDGGGYCVDCPLCYLVTFKPFFRWDVTRQVTMIDYTVMSDNNLSDYFQQHWKPPCGSILS